MVMSDEIFDLRVLEIVAGNDRPSALKSISSTDNICEESSGSGGSGMKFKSENPPLIRKAGRNLEYKSSPRLKLRASKLFDVEPCK